MDTPDLSHGQDSLESPPALTAREQILHRMEAWLDEALASEAQPEGIPGRILAELEEADARSAAGEADACCDLYSLWSAMTALTQEVKLQGRAFKDLSNGVAPFAELGTAVDAALQAHQEALAQSRSLAEAVRSAQAERERTIERDTEQRVSRQLLEVLLDVRDRLDRGLQLARTQFEQAEKPFQTWWARWLFVAGRTRARRSLEVVSALLKGYSLSLDRLDETLGRFGVREIPGVNQPFDPRCMAAVDLDESGSHPDGTVVEVYRAGYTWNGQVFRPAEVKVARSAARENNRDGGEWKQRFPNDDQQGAGWE